MTPILSFVLSFVKVSLYFGIYSLHEMRSGVRGVGVNWREIPQMVAIQSSNKLV